MSKRRWQGPTPRVPASSTRQTDAAGLGTIFQRPQNLGGSKVDKPSLEKLQIQIHPLFVMVQVGQEERKPGFRERAEGEAKVEKVR